VGEKKLDRKREMESGEREDELVASCTCVTGPLLATTTKKLPPPKNTEGIHYSVFAISLRLSVIADDSQSRSHQKDVVEAQPKKNIFLRMSPIFRWHEKKGQLTASGTNSPKVRIQPLKG
jgi:hypothetical protein